MVRPKIVNIVGSGQLPKRFNLDELSNKLYTVDAVKNIEYDVENYPGLLFKIKKPKTHVTLFSTGKYIILGATNTKDLNRAYDELVRILKKLETI